MPSVLSRTGVLALATLALLAAACGEPRPPLESLAAAAERTTATGTARVSLSMAVAVPQPGVPSVSIDGSGVLDYAGRRGQMSFDMSKMMGAASGDMGSMEMVFDGTVVYMKMPFVTQQLGGRPWVKIDAAKVAGQKDRGLAALQQFGGADPTKALAFLRAAGDDVREVGADEVRGVQTTHYRFTIDPEMLQQDAAALPGGLEQAVAEMIPTSRVNAWIDDEGLLRKLTYSIGLPGMGSSATMDITVEQYDFGAEVDVDIPDAGEVMDYTEFLRRGKAMSMESSSSKSVSASSSGSASSTTSAP